MAEHSNTLLFRFWLVLGLLWLLVVSVLSLIPLDGTGINDKWSHLLTYVFLTLWFSLLCSDRNCLILLVVGLSGFGGLIEGLQSLTSYRTAEGADLAANLAGIAVGLACYRLAIHRHFRHRLNG